MTQDSLIRFSDSIILDAEEKRDKYICEINKKNAEWLENKSRELKQKFEKTAYRQCARIKSKAESEIAAQKNKATLELINLRDRMFSSVFKEVEKNLKDYITTDEYTQQESEELIKAAELLGGKTARLKCLTKAEDLAALKLASRDYCIEFQETDDEIIGGFILESHETKRMINNTFKIRLEEEKQRFLVYSGLILK